ncbi:pyrrolo-quinoline quinone [Chakrabartia godavariana]|nr:pyrrolo-quinoline quinone [Chakrabartia godavariana]
MKRLSAKFGRSLLLVPVLVAVAGCSVFGGGGDKKPKTPVLGQRVAILASEAAAEADPALADVSVLLPPAQRNDSWTQPGGNGSKSMEHLALGQSLSPAWNTSIRGTSSKVRLASAPVVAGGRVYVMDTDARIHAFDSKTGREVWTASFSAEGKDRKAAWGGGVSVDGDVLYATNGLGDVGALKAADGSVIWKKRPGGPLRGAPSFGIGNVYAMSSDNQIFALKASDGSVEWTEAGATELTGVFGVAAPAIAQGTVVAGFSSGELNAYRYENGRVLWADALTRTSISTSVSALSDIDASPVVDRGRVFAVGKGGRMVSLELVTGQRLWEINVGGIATPWVSGEWVFVVTDDARLLCIARGSGKVRWAKQLPRYRKESKKKDPISWSGPILAGDRLILASSQGQLVNVSPADGTVQSTMKTNGAVLLSPVVADGMLYVLTNDGRLTAWR